MQAQSISIPVGNGQVSGPLPWPTADRLVTVSEYPRLREQVMAEGVDLVSWPNLEDWRRRQRTFERIVGYRYGLFSLTRAGDPEALLGASVSWDFFAVTGTPPRLGRGFRPEEDIPSPPRVVVISHRIWQERMDARADAVGRALEIDGQPYTVIGVMDEGYEFPAALPQGITIDVRTAELWIPLLGQRPNDARGNRNFMALGLLRPGVDVATAQDDMSRVARELEQEYPDQNSGQSVRVTLLRERWIGHVRPALLILLGAIASVLLIACVNVANLILARGRTRMRELGVRTALGASPGRLIRQLGVEYLVLAGMGGLLGLFVAWLSLRGLLLLRPENLPRAAAIRLDGWTLLMTAGLTLLTAVLVGLLPTLRLTRGSRLAGDSPRTGGQSPAGTRVRHALTVAQVAVSLMLLVGAGLLLKSFVGLTRARLGNAHDRQERRSRQGRRGAPRQACEGRRRGRHRLGGDRRRTALRLQGQAEEEVLASSPAIPFFQPHELVVVAPGRVGGIELGGEGLAAGQPLRCRIEEIAPGMGEEFLRPHVLVGTGLAAELAPISRQ